MKRLSFDNGNDFDVSTSKGLQTDNYNDIEFAVHVVTSHMMMSAVYCSTLHVIQPLSHIVYPSVTVFCLVT